MSNREPRELRWECPECEAHVEVSPCPYCGCQEVESVWSDGQRVDAHDVEYVVEGES